MSSSSGTRESPPPQPDGPQLPAEEPQQRRGRGRPRKQQQKVEPAGQRRPRGRPRKWLQKLVENASEEQEVMSEERETGGPAQSEPSCALEGC
ncbi:high mobility group AT-hook 2b isoform X2 [Entelurus aequoreus]|uniref:high mobility group AT-hook 2b isoform X2 n=1 Tax=Entelurus aequoreus TaxID=161455 RepID=UPI002B1E3CB4|nr:high mobility group AT-hook 2b isoform X2 [Entelurus aequoreus]